MPDSISSGGVALGSGSGEDFGFEAGPHGPIGGESPEDYLWNAAMRAAGGYSLDENAKENIRDLIRIGLIRLRADHRENPVWLAIAAGNLALFIIATKGIVPGVDKMLTARSLEFAARAIDIRGHPLDVHAAMFYPFWPPPWRPSNV